MNAQQLAVKEQIVKTVVKSGNGGAVWVPKDWLGEEVVVILPKKPRLSIKENVIRLLEPYLKDIMAVGIYGSYARNEQTSESDIDVLVITGDKKISLNFKKGKFDIVSFMLDKFKIAIKKYPVIYYQIAQEAAPLINAHAFWELKNIKIGKESFKSYLNETDDHLKSSRELLELDKIDGAYLKSYSVLYSAILRLRGLFIINCILNNDNFLNKAFKHHLLSSGLTLSEFEDSYKAYRLIRDNKAIKNLQIMTSAAEKVLNTLGKEVRRLEARVYGK